MADKPNERELRRFSHVERFQEELWSLAYETVLPVIRRTPIKDRMSEQAEPSPGRFAITRKIGA